MYGALLILLAIKLILDLFCKRVFSNNWKFWSGSVF